MGIDRTSIDAPQFRLLTDEKIQAIHDGALHVLETTGIDVAHEEARSMLLGAGARREGERRIMIPRALVERSIESAPGSFVLHDRFGNEALRLGEGQTYYGAGVTNLAYRDIDGDEHDFTLDDVGKVAFLADALPNIDFVSTPGVIKPSAGNPLEITDQRAFVQMVTNTTMPLVVLTPDAYQMEDIFEMAEVVAGGREAFEARPFVMPYLNTVSPLLINPETVDKLFLAADRGTPVCVQAAPPVGGSAPVTVAGAAVICAAETLAGLVLSQLRRPGMPYVTGVIPFIMDMRSGNTASSGPQLWQLVIAMGELSRRWGIPSVSTGGGDSKLPDEQAGFDVSYGSQGAMYGGHDMCINMGRLECGLLHSPEVLVYANEAISMHRDFAQGVRVDDVTLALDVIADVGPGGFFLGHQHTLDHFRELWHPTVASWEPRDMWEERGSTTMGERAREQVRRIRDEHEVAPLPEEVLAGMQAVIDRREAMIEVEND